MKNNKAEGVLLSPEEYINLIDEVNDARLLTIATKRLENYNPNTVLSEEDINTRFGITSDDLVDFEEVEIE